MIMVKQLHTGQSLLIALDLCQPHYQNLLITYLKGFIKISVKFVNLNLVLLLRKGLYPYEYMESWERFDKTSLPEKEAFYSKLNKKSMNNIDYAPAQKVWGLFEIKSSFEYHSCMFKGILYCLLMYLKTLETNALRFMNLILTILCQHQD